MSCDEDDYAVLESDGEAAVGAGPDGVPLKPVSFLLKDGSPLEPSRSDPKNPQEPDNDCEQLESRFVKLLEHKSAVGDSTRKRLSCVTSPKRFKKRGIIKDALAATKPKKAEKDTAVRLFGWRPGTRNSMLAVESTVGCCRRGRRNSKESNKAS